MWNTEDLGGSLAKLPLKGYEACLAVRLELGGLDHMRGMREGGGQNRSLRGVPPSPAVWSSPARLD
jgi:hypothetical protein